MENSESNSPNSSESPGATEAKDLGFGSKVMDKQVRMMNPDGTANVIKLGIPWFRPYDMYKTLISMSWGRFAAVVAIFYLILNIVFSSLYLIIGLEHLAGVEGDTSWEKFLDAFFFSSQTVTTLGYGRIAPVGAWASTVAAIEALIGLLGFALVTGLLYGRFSRPKAKIKFSDRAIVAPYEEGKALMFRMMNERSSNLMEVEAVVTIAYMTEGSSKREFDRLDLEIDKITFLPLSWTLVHPILEGGPLYGWSYDDMVRRGLEMIVLIKAFDDSFGSIVYQRRSYTTKEISWGEKFVSVIGTNGTSMTIDMARLSETVKVELP